MPILTGISVFCLANQKNLNYTNIFGGSYLFSACRCLSFLLQC